MDTPTDFSKRYQVGAKTDSGHTITTVLGQSKRVTVYISDEGHLRWDYYGNDGNLPPDRYPAIEMFDGLLNRIGSELSQSDKNLARTLLGKALFSALEADAAISPEITFKKVSIFIEERAKQFGRFVYTVSALVTFVLICTCLGFVARLHPDLNSTVGLMVFCGIAGGTGSVISVLQRGSALNTDPLSAVYYLIFQGASRAILGCTFGSLFALFNRSHLLLSALATTPEAIVCLAVIAGVSERFIPELMTSFETGMATRQSIAKEADLTTKQPIK